METANNQIPEEKKIRWVNKTGTVRLVDGRKFARGKPFYAYEREIPQGFRDVILPLGPVPVKPVLKPIAGFKLEDKGGGYYDVVNVKSGKAIFEKGMRREEAESKLANLLEG
jgi:hypothetical protein